MGALDHFVSLFTRTSLETIPTHLLKILYSHGSGGGNESWACWSYRYLAAWLDTRVGGA